eukprot:4299639-Amphidinium_carterae.1
MGKMRPLPVTPGMVVPVVPVLPVCLGSTSPMFRLPGNTALAQGKWSPVASPAKSTPLELAIGKTSLPYVSHNLDRWHRSHAQQHADEDLSQTEQPEAQLTQLFQLQQAVEQGPKA